MNLAPPIIATLVATIWIVQWSPTNRFDFDNLKSDMNRRFEEAIKRFDQVEAKLDVLA